MRILKIYLFFCFLLLPFACIKQETEIPDHKPIKVEVKNIDGAYHLFRDDKQYFIKGAGGSSNLAELSKRGGNSIRTWSTRRAESVLDSAYKYGLTVLMGLHVERERHGFDYDDEQAVQKQLVRLTNEVKKYKNHPALLGWGIGNELNLSYTNKKVWNAVNDIAEMIHNVDGNHPATTMLAGIKKEDVDYIKEHCSALDFLSIQMYADVINLPQRLVETNWNGPYVITEWGATGHWEVPKTDWGAAIEQNSTERAKVIKEQYEKVISKDTIQCLGSYVFLWGQKQERTPTWYGLFTENGETMESVDILQYLWTKKWPENMTPQIFNVRLNEKSKYDNIRLKKNHDAILTFNCNDLEKDPLKIDVELLPESTDLGEGGDYESRPQPMEDLIIEKKRDKIIFKTPLKKGAYRIFVYISDDKNHTATANVPFYVE